MGGRRESLRVVPAAGGAGPLLRISIEEHGMAFFTVTPRSLRLFCFRNVIREHEVETLRNVAATRGATSLIRKPVVEHEVALAAISPQILNGGDGLRRERQRESRGEGDHARP